MRNVLIVAHGFPSDPEPAQAALETLATKVEALLPDAKVGAATLACTGALREAVAAQPDALIYPFFMAEGWFTKVQLPRRLAELDHSAEILPPFGREPALPDLIGQTLKDAGPEVILVAHGSQVSRSSHDMTVELARTLAPRLPKQHLRLAFLEEMPHLREVAAHYRAATCLPLFVLRGGHVAQDVPQALEEAGFSGTLLPALGELEDVPALIAESLRAK
ncbi:sirohydrochlorin ferrochelatase [Rhodobacter sp. JA431]|uniref:sirohydrochlorin chelatase n=1 Tax=Rhodobacter sp. JA431 TaxID=570013 RepID=UPI000BD1326E|nr:CbiX/SirB N-terminal domain-containing protein [Rhodobacter sp. JA431]SOC07753.1 sirohydrochlorin ferrochelatase [Rhodobacter sp. JA431]